jgi:hypothetical protein
MKGTEEDRAGPWANLFAYETFAPVLASFTAL